MTQNQKAFIVKGNFGKGNKMDRQELITKVKELSLEVEKMNTEKATSLESELARQSAFYHWCREQMMAVHQMKYQFSQEVARLNQEGRKITQEYRQQICVMRGGQPPVTMQAPQADLASDQLEVSSS